MRIVYLMAAALWGVAPPAAAADRFFGYNNTTSTDFTAAFLSPAGTATWGPNQTANDKDHGWEAGERLPVTGIARGRFDLKLVDRGGHVCVKHGVDLTSDTTFEVRDEDLARCGP
jgi:hypothetical protein